jgi:hypothetical protein
MAKLIKSSKEVSTVKLVRKQELQTREDFYEGENEVEIPFVELDNWLQSQWGWELVKEEVA